MLLWVSRVFLQPWGWSGSLDHRLGVLLLARSQPCRDRRAGTQVALCKRLNRSRLMWEVSPVGCKALVPLFSSVPAPHQFFLATSVEQIQPCPGTGASSPVRWAARGSEPPSCPEPLEPRLGAAAWHCQSRGAGCSRAEVPASLCGRKHKIITQEGSGNLITQFGVI